jgi:hypothetical protein
VLIGFIDDTEFLVTGDTKQPDVFVFGGYFIEHARLDALQRQVVDIKQSFGLRADSPVKWNVKDLKKVYDHSEDGELYQVLLHRSDQVRRALLDLIPEFDAQVLACALHRYSETPDSRDCYRWTLENLLQRVGLMAQAIETRYHQASSTMVVLDWTQKKTGKGLFDIYAAGYYEGQAVDCGQPYFSGPLAHHRFADSLLFGSMIHSGPLQLADLITGCVREFLTWCFKGHKRQRVKAFFPAIATNFYCNSDGQVDGCGLKVSPKPLFSIDEKIAEISQ